MDSNTLYDVIDFIIVSILSILAVLFTYSFIVYLREVDKDGRDRVTIATVICVILALASKILPKLISMVYSESHGMTVL